MKISDKDLRDLMRREILDVKFIWLTDNEYLLPSLEVVKEMLSHTDISGLKFIPSIQDCDDFALHLHSQVKKIRGRQAADGIIPASEALSWPMGEVFCSRFNGVNGLHNANFVVCEDMKVYMIEPQTKEIRLYSKLKDAVHIMKS